MRAGAIQVNWEGMPPKNGVAPFQHWVLKVPGNGSKHRCMCIYDMQCVYKYIYIYTYIYPPTPALAQAGAAPGTTGGVEPAGLSKPTQACLSKRAGKTLAATCFKGVPNASANLSMAAGNNSRSYMPQPGVFYGVRSCRLPPLKPRKPRKPSRRPFQGNNSRSTCLSPCVSNGVQGCRLPALKPLNRSAGLSKATTFAATGPSQVFFTAFEAAVCPPSNPANPANPAAGLSKATTLAAHASAMRFKRRSRLPFARFETSKPSLRPVQGNHFRSYRPQPGVFYGVRSCRLPPLKPRKPRCRPFQGNNSRSTCLSPCVSNGVQGCRLPALKPLNRPSGLSNATTFAATGPSQVFLRRSKLLFARRQAPQTPP